MTKDIWINLPVSDLARSREFFTRIGLPPSDGHAPPDMACLLIGEKKVAVMLVDAKRFASFSKHEIADTKRSSEILISIDAESREEVDALAKKANEAGGIVYAEPGESQGWMYGCGFADLDGHRWNVLYMDREKMPRRA